MNPFYFGAGRRRLFGAYEPARLDSRHTRAVVFCYPWGSEYLHAHRSMRRLATMLTEAGFHTLRFDYFGTGDSAGDVIEADIEGWEADIESAMEELKDTTGAVRITLLGLRLGATLAAIVAAKRHRDVDAVVLWDPIVSGGEYLQALHQAHQSNPRIGQPPLSRPAESGGGYEFLGCPLTARMVQDIEAIDLAAVVPVLPMRTLLMASDSLPAEEVLRRMRSGRSPELLAVEHIASDPAWVESFGHAGLVPVEILRRIVQWLE
jgi:pimeloyl-ACP methyl ester carboxylesterase